MNGNDRDLGAELQNAVARAASGKQSLSIVGGGSKAFFGRTATGVPLVTASHRGILEYEPSELVVSARCGTPVSALEAAVAAEHQMLAFEPPHFGHGATLGGTIACGLSGPRRPYAGAARDFVLGVRLINGRGETLSFGGRVMKNVAGYDLSRLMTGALGTLGVLLDVTLKILPRPAAELTLVQECGAEQALQRCNEWAARTIPLSATCHDGQTLYIRLSGAETTLREIRATLGGDTLDDADTFWNRLREHELPFFSGTRTLWRLSVPPNTPMLRVDGRWLLDWGGAQRWLITDAEPQTVHAEAAASGGHAQRFRGADRDGDVFHPLSPAAAVLHRNLKAAFDPHGILNPGRMYKDL